MRQFVSRLSGRSDTSACTPRMATLATVVGGLLLGTAQPASALPIVPRAAQPATVPIQPLLAEAPTLPTDGFYLFGEQPVPDQLATAYFVFELQAGRVTGAFYMPLSSFDCVHGQMTDTELALTVTESYSQERYPYAMSFTQEALVASAGEASALSLDGFYQLDDLSDNDHRLIEACQTTGELI
ncbi:MAG: hypothetical protein AAFZ80_07905 [Cyanobacteria bacterium P01_A01_bin.105]